MMPLWEESRDVRSWQDWRDACERYAKEYDGWAANRDRYVRMGYRTRMVGVQTVVAGMFSFVVIASAEQFRGEPVLMAGLVFMAAVCCAAAWNAARAHDYLVRDGVMATRYRARAAWWRAQVAWLDSLKTGKPIAPPAPLPEGWA